MNSLEIYRITLGTTVIETFATLVKAYYLFQICEDSCESLSPHQKNLMISGHLHEIDNFKKQIDSYEVQITTMRRQNDELDTQMKTNLARISGMETTLAAAQREIEKITELNNRLQMDKNELGG
ncbi:unnamed protein product [Gongylonema pulchrum]|uniref:Spc7 domain-containing protein n=1 Tax=Gongylonema pulchrum TaxID=637853 RepID=A0A183DIJ2_9BILA|nr:unnamed protein product [Gongylonema pulchrum]